MNGALEVFIFNRLFSEFNKIRIWGSQIPDIQQKDCQYPKMNLKCETNDSIIECNSSLHILITE